MRLVKVGFQVTAVAGLLASAWVLGAQERPVFRAGVEAVAVDVVVVDRDGHPLTDLTVEDFTLLVDGRPRSVVSLEYVPMVSKETQTPAVAEPSHFSTNVGAGSGRLVLFVVDRENIRAGEGKPAMVAAKRFLDRLSPNDRTGLFVLPRGEPRIEFTSDKNRIRKGLDEIFGLGSEAFGMYNIGLSEALAVRRRDRFALGEVVARECAADPDPSCPDLVEQEALAIARLALWRTSESLRSLHSLIEVLREIDAPKVLVLLSQGLVHDMENYGDVVPLARTAAAARVTLYAVQIDSPLADASRQRPAPTPMEDLALLADGMGALASATRGALFRGGASYDSALTRIERELAGYYLLAFEAEETDRDGNPHRITVSCRRTSGTIMRSRSEFVIPSDYAEENEPDELARVLRDPFPATALPVEATTYTLLDPSSDRRKLLLVAQVGRAPEWPRSASLAWAVLDERGKPVASRLETLAQAEGGSMPLRFAKSIPIEPGSYTVKVAAKGEAGVLGSVEHVFDVPERTDEDLELSDLVLIDLVEPAMPLTSVVTGSAPGVKAYLEIGSREPNLPSDLLLSFDVLDPNDERSVAQSVVEVRRAEQTGRWVAEGSVPLRSLPPRDYVLRAGLLIGGRLVHHVDRRFRWSPGAETARMGLEAFPAGPPRDYAELAEQYRNGGFVDSARELSRWSRKSVEGAAEYFETRVRSDRDRLSAALLHTDVVLRGAEDEDEDYHLEVAKRLLGGIADASLHARVERQWYLLMGEYLRYMNEDGMAVSVLELALDRFPEDEETLLLIGATCEAAGWMRKDEEGPWLDGAEKFYRRLLEAEPEHREAHLRLGHIFSLKKRFEDATREIESSLRRDLAPEMKAVAHLLLGEIHRTKGKTLEAIDDYRAALALHPHFSTAAAVLSYGLFEAGELDGSRNVIQRYYAAEGGATAIRDPWWRYLRGDRGMWLERLTMMRKELR